MNIDESTLLKMLNPKYKDLFELVAKRGIDEIQRDNPELMEQIRKELILSGLGSEAERLFMSKKDWKRNVNNQLDEWADIHEADADDMFGGDGF